MKRHGSPGYPQRETGHRCRGGVGPWLWIVAAMSLPGMSGLARAEMGPIDEEVVTDGWSAASTDELETQRGGFQLENGVTIDISVSRTVAINGVVEYTSDLKLPANLTMEQVRESIANSVSSNVNSGVATANGVQVIRNTLDNQVITNMTTMNIVVSNLRNLENAGAQGRYLPSTDTVLIR